MSDVAWQRTAEFVSSQVADLLVILDLDGGMYYSLNGPAADVWALLASSIREEKVVDALVARYKVAPEACAKSVQRLLKELSEKGLAKHSG